MILMSKSYSLAQQVERENETLEGLGSSPGRTYFFLFVAYLTIYLLRKQIKKE